jgi:hypothetical protein
VQVWAAIVGLGALTQTAYWLVSEPPDLFSDFFKAYYPAGRMIVEDGPSAVWPYAEEGASGFVNLPILSWLFTPFAMLNEATAGWAFLGFGLVSVVVTIHLIAMLLPAATSLKPIAVLFLVNGPMVNSAREGNTTHIVLAFVVASGVLLQRGQPFWAGGVLGFASAVKLPLILFGLYFALKRQWSVVAGGLSAAMILLAASIAVHGVQAHVDWLEGCILPFLGKSVPAFNVQSIDGFLARLWAGDSRLREWDPVPRYPVQSMLGLAATSAILLTVAVTILRQPSDPDSRQRLDLREFSLVLATAIVTTPLSWTHYYLFLLLPFSLVATGAIALGEQLFDRMIVPVSVVLASFPVVDLVLPQGILSDLISRSLLSIWLFGGLLTIAWLLRARSTPDHPKSQMLSP